VFGLFGSFTSTAQVSGSAVDMTAVVGNTAAAAPGCAAVIPAAGTAYLSLRNTGTSSATTTTITFNFGGKTFQQAAACLVTAGQTEYITETGLGAAAGTAVVGAQFVATVGLSNGGSVAIAGAFE